MTGIDLEEYAALWQAEPTQAEEREFQALADGAARRAQFVQYAEHGLAVMLLVAVLIAVVMAPAPATVGIGLLSIAALAWSSWRRHLLGQIAFLVETSDRSRIVAHAIVAARANLRRSTLGLGLFLPGILLGALLTHSFNQKGDLSDFAEVFFGGALHWPEGYAILFLLVVLGAQLIRANIGFREELQRLESLQEAYREETRRDSFMLGPNAPTGPVFGALTK
jgi:hypothetical protein